MATPQQAPQQAPQPPGNEAVVLTVAGLLLTSLTVDAAMTGLDDAGVAELAGMALTTAAMRASWRVAFSIVMGHPPGQDGFYGQAGRQVARTNLLRRAQFTVSAAQRLSQDVSRAISARQPIATALDAGVTRERRFYGQHLMAIWARQKAGAQADSSAQDYGRMLGWHTVIDGKTSRECRRADGKNFYVDRMPLIGYPGSVHPSCRCEPGEPFDDGAILPSYGLDLRRAA